MRIAKAKKISGVVFFWSFVLSGICAGIAIGHENEVRYWQSSLWKFFYFSFLICGVTTITSCILWIISSWALWVTSGLMDKQEFKRRFASVENDVTRHYHG